jgi:tetratricopeptide (TPR) repeat protein
MKRTLSVVLLLMLRLAVSAGGLQDQVVQDTNQVNKLNKIAYDSRFTNPEQTVSGATRALELAQKLEYTNGIAEAYRIIGIGRNYLNQPEKAIDSYLTALTYFAKSNSLLGEARVYNNIGILYRDNDYDRSLDYLNKGLVIAQKLGAKQLIGSLYLNIGNVYYRKKSFYQALNYYDKSNASFIQLKDSVNLITCLQNRGVIYYNLNQFDKAQELLLQANMAAKQKDLNELVASIDLTLASLYIAQKDYPSAERIVKEGIAYAQLVKDTKLEYDYKYTTYELQFKQNDFADAINTLREIYKHDSLIYKSVVSTRINLLGIKHQQEETQKENELIIARQKYNSVKFWAATVVSGLLLVLVALLVGNVKRKNQTNKRLTDLNSEVSRQKDNLDRINHHLEEIIDERTRDLQVKNKKLSEYSSYLSHQIRGPIATLKGLMNLEKEGLVDQRECINMMNKCVSEIDERIIDMSDMLHDPERTGF